jgi:DNA-binding LacI/PurR family transcriptional regulator
LRSIATLVGVTPATVSLALRDSPEISRETRERVKRAAESLGYQPDPELRKLMHRLRVTRTPAYRSTLCALTDLPLCEPRVERLLQGARARAAELGFDVAFESWPAEDDAIHKLHRGLHHRGVEGVLLLPARTASAFAHLGDWSKFSVVATSRQPANPDFDRVVAHWYWSTSRALEELSAQGYTRIGLVHSAEFDRNINHKLSAAMILRDGLSGVRHLARFAYIDRTTLAAARGETIESWFDRESPDAIILDHPEALVPLRDRLGLEIPGPVAMVTLNRESDSPLAGVNERWGDIGAFAVNLLSQKILSGQKGPSAVPMVTMIKGAWTHAPSVQRRAG